MLVDEDARHLYVQAGQVFQPATPIATRELFAGRFAQIARVADAVGQRGLHVAIYGERGVGKTSLANILNDISVLDDAIVVRVNCDAIDTFLSVWAKLVDRLYRNPLIAGLPERQPAIVTPDDVVQFLEYLPQSAVCIFDEFDRLSRDASQVFSDLIKSLSDHAVPSTVVLVGVAETVTDLVEEHASIERALVQVQMPRMKDDELREILTKASAQLGTTFSDNAAAAIVALSQGLPHYTHLLGRESTRAAIGNGHLNVSVRYVRDGIRMAIENAQETIRDQYARAVRSARKDALYAQVLLSCAMAEKGERSSFRASDVTKPMTQIMKKDYNIPAISAHLKAFCDDPDRAKPLVREGRERNYVYRFRNPLMESYVLMRGIADELVEPDLLRVPDIAP